MTWYGRQMTSYEKDGVTATFKYDADGLRGSKEVNGVTTTYQYVGNQLFYENKGNGIELYYFYDSFGSLNCIRYIKTESTDTQTVRTYYTATNSQGDVISIFHENGSLLARYDYDAWGKIVAIRNADGEKLNSTENSGHIAILNSIRYRGYYYDNDLKLYYLQSRYYNAEIGRFINADGFITTGQGVLSYNMFAYCMNNPVMYSDPSGMVCGLCLCTGVYPCPACMPTMPGFSNMDLLFGTTKAPQVTYVSTNYSAQDIIDTSSNVYDAVDLLSQFDSAIYMNTNHYLINNAPSASELYSNAFSYGLIGAETTYGIYNNYITGAANKKIVWDAAVDVVVLASTSWCSSSAAAATCVAYGTALNPGAGTAVGAVVGICVSLLFSFVTDGSIDYLKGWVD